MWIAASTGQRADPSDDRHDPEPVQVLPLDEADRLDLVRVRDRDPERCGLPRLEV